MADFPIFKISQLTTSTASIIMGGIVAIQNNFQDGLKFLMAGIVATIFLRIIEHIMFIENHANGRLR